MTDRIPIATAELIGKGHAYDQVIIYARRIGDDGLEWVTTWGKNRTHCDAAARIGDALGRHVVQPIEDRDQEIDRLRALLASAGEALAVVDRLILPGMENCRPDQTIYGPTGEGATIIDLLRMRSVAAEIREATNHG